MTRDMNERIFKLANSGTRDMNNRIFLRINPVPNLCDCVVADADAQVSRLAFAFIRNKVVDDVFIRVRQNISQVRSQCRATCARAI